MKCRNNKLFHKTQQLLRKLNKCFRNPIQATVFVFEYFPNILFKYNSKLFAFAFVFNYKSQGHLRVKDDE